MNKIPPPQAGASVVDRTGNATRPWFAFWQGLWRLQTKQDESLGALDMRVKALEDAPPSSGAVTAKIIGDRSVDVTGLLSKGVVSLQLKGDVRKPLVTQYYGTDDSGVRGWFNVSDTIAGTADNITLTVDDDTGVTTFDLADLADSGTGTFKLITRDTKGRVSGMADGTTDDVPEGSTNLYFTAPRAQAAVVASGITEGDTTHSPSGDAVFDALALKADASDLDAHEADTDNPHEVTAAQVGLGNVDNTSDADKPVSTAQQASIDALVPHGAMAYLSSAIALASGDTLLVPFSAASFDDDSWWSSGSPTRLTVPTGVARVRIVIAAGFAAQSGGNRIAYLSKNGNANFLGRCSQRIAPSGGVDYLNASTGLLAVSPGDYFELAVSQNSGSAVNVQGTPDGYYTWLAIEAVPAP